ncbi:MAG TPA: hypothetical protein VKA78_17095 [Pyrinomonadaceae bacterium]|nr:hypothetical protein [Pyrinomonadaceae bacterium]
MAATLTEAEFSKHLNTKFRIAGDQPIELELTEVKGYLSKAHEQSGMERFSAFFNGPREPYLPQRVYALEHERMGAFELFLVPLARDENGVRYEAVFNYFKNSAAD